MDFCLYELGSTEDFAFLNVLPFCNVQGKVSLSQTQKQLHGHFGVSLSDRRCRKGGLQGDPLVRLDDHDCY
jgi:hypothetical protein